MASATSSSVVENRGVDDDVVNIITENILGTFKHAGLTDDQTESILSHVSEWLCKSSHATIQHLCKYRNVVQDLVAKASTQVMQLQDEASHVHRQIDVREKTVKQIKEKNAALNSAIISAERENDELTARLLELNTTRRNMHESLKTQKGAFERTKKTLGEHVRKNAGLSGRVIDEEKRLADLTSKLAELNDEAGRACADDQERMKVTQERQRSIQEHLWMTIDELQTITECLQTTQDSLRDKKEELRMVEEELRMVRDRIPSARTELESLRRLEEQEGGLKSRHEAVERRVAHLRYQLGDVNREVYDTLRQLAASKNFTLEANARFQFADESSMD
jgi:chromosome segregation ATPase